MKFLAARERRGSIARAVLVASAMVLLGASSASARQWKPTPQLQSQDYSMIQDNRPNGDLIIIFWLSPQMVADKDMQAILSTNLVLGALDAHIGSDGKVTFSPADSLTAKDSQGNSLSILKGDDIPPTVSGSVQTLESVFRQSLGSVGAAVQWYVLDGKNIHSCSAGGGFSVQFAGENYVYDAPIPGCPKD
jgi:hypothetical protein